MSAGRRRITMMGGVGCLLALLLAAAPAGAAPQPAHVVHPPRVAQSTPSTSSTTPLTSPTTTSTPATTPTDPFQPVTGLTPEPAATLPVAIVDFGYSPATITVRAGTTVVWTNTGQAIHSVTSDTGLFDSSPSCPAGACIDPGGTFSHTFTTAGRFAYHCRVHSNMHGTVIVKPAATTPTTTAPGSTVSAGGGAGASTSVAAQASGPQLAFTGAAADELWIALGALVTMTLGLALRPRRRPFPVPVEHRRAR
jgi:plastocyanin